MENKIFISSENSMTEINSNEINGLTVNFGSGEGNKVILNENSRFENLKISVSGSFNTVIIGKKTSINACTILLNGDFNYRKVNIGCFTYIGGAFIQLLKDYSMVEIGDDCMLSDGINIVNDRSIKIFDLETKEYINIRNNIYIGNHVWIGRNSFIDGDTIIADDCIVGTKAFVSGHFTKSYCSIAGNPAKTIKSGVNFLKCAMRNFDINIKNINQ